MCSGSLKFPVTVISPQVPQCRTAPLVHGYQIHGPGQADISGTTGAGAGTVVVSQV